VSIRGYIPLVACLPFLVWISAAQINVPTANYDNYRTNSNPNETILTPATVASGFGKVGGFPVDGQIFAQPLYISGVQMLGVGAKNVVYVATMNDSVYAIDADAPGATSPLWQVSLGNPATTSVLPDAMDINPRIGILSTPVIDLASQVIYVVAETFENGAPVFRLHGLSLAAGQETFNGPVVISASVPGSGAESVNGIVSFDPLWHLQRPGLALANGNVYVAFGSHGDAGPYHGWVMAYNASNLQQQAAVFNTTPNGSGGGIWQSGRAPAIDAAGNVYVASGNGDFDGITNLGGAMIKLAGANLSVIDWYTPVEWQYLDANDLDLGSTGGVLVSDGGVPGGNLVVAGDKGGRLINLDSGAMGGIESSAGADDFQASPAGIFQVSVWQSAQGPLLYEHDWNGPLKAYPVGTVGISATPVLQGTWTGDSLYQGMAVSSNGGTGGIVWETTGDHSQPGVPATLHAWNASDLTQELWNSGMQPGEVLGVFMKFAIPLVANGRVYVPTASNQLVIYGLLPAGGANEQGPQISAALNGASFIEDSLSPGEVVTILGANLGPASPADLALDGNGNVTNQLLGTQVFFDGVAAPLLYTSSSQVNAVVPYGVTATATQVTVQYGGLLSVPALVPVVPATPALFSFSGLGSGQALILNQDGSVNSSINPAAAGSVAVLYATGLGQTNPSGQDGVVVSAILPVPAASISVMIGGAPAQVLYAGAAPGMVSGIFQINVQIPANAPSGSNIPVLVQAGNAVSPGGATLAIQ
jgi:uncharacterized protein (TIGR03437 family)